MRHHAWILGLCSGLLMTSGCHMLTGKTAGQAVDDAALMAAVKARLVSEQPENAIRVDVDTNQGVVYLTGTVRSDEERRRAEQLASAVDGVRRVENRLMVEDDAS